MFDTLIDNMNFFTSSVIAIAAIGAAIALIVFYHASVNEFFSPSIVYTATAVIVYGGFLPLLNYAADKEQYGTLVGAARQALPGLERPWYGMGGYQFLILVVIILSGSLIAWINRRRY